MRLIYRWDWMDRHVRCDVMQHVTKANGRGSSYPSGVSFLVRIQGLIWKRSLLACVLPKGYPGDPRSVFEEVSWEWTVVGVVGKYIDIKTEMAFEMESPCHYAACNYMPKRKTQKRMKTRPSTPMCIQEWFFNAVLKCAGQEFCIWCGLIALQDIARFLTVWLRVKGLVLKWAPLVLVTCPTRASLTAFSMAHMPKSFRRKHEKWNGRSIPTELFYGVAGSKSRNGCLWSVIMHVTVPCRRKVSSFNVGWFLFQ